MPLLPKRTRERLIRPYVEVHRKLDAIWDAIECLQSDVDRIQAVARHIYDEEPENRRRLAVLRESEEYELAFSESEPLVSFLVPTYDSYSTLGEVALPSILNQSYSNLEVIVVGDAAPAETAEVIEQVGDSRVRYYNRTVRGPYPDDARRWYVVGTPPFNDALSMARGRWIAVLGDDDSARPRHTQTLLEAAKENHYEHCYGHQLVRFSEGGELRLGEFPPRLGQWGLQAAIYHSGLRFFGLELTDALYEEPNDWSLCRRMLRAGVRFGIVDQVVVDKHESRRTAEQWEAGVIPDVE
jgi:glycosyl transferase family 2